MSISRREFLRLSGLVAGGAVLASCTPVYREAAKWANVSPPPQLLPGIEVAWLRRLTYGPSNWDRNFVGDYGLDAWIEEQLSPASIEDLPVNLRLRTFDFLGLEANALVGWKERNLSRDFRQATLIRKIYSRRQLYEQMVEFWTDHFNITIAKGDCWFLKIVDDEQVIRRHAMGNFRDLLWASAHSPAMLVYLDNQANHKDAPNENYARELMELHTLGVDGGYSQGDVMELARCLTGWTVKENFWRGDFQFDPELHDSDEKSVLGMRVEPDGISEAEMIIEILATHPATARLISEKLVRRFITDTPMESAPELVALGAETFLKTDGDIPSILAVILQTGEPLLDRQIQSKFKRPLDFITSALRILDAETDGGPNIHDYLSGMGQPLYEWPTPDGPPDHADAWGTLLSRWKFALELARGELSGTQISFPDLNPDSSSDPGKLVGQISHRLDLNMSKDSIQSLDQALNSRAIRESGELPAIITGGLIASPAFQWR